MEVIISLGVLVVLGIILFLPVKPSQRTRTKRKYRGAGVVLFGINEFFAPSAANATIVMEEKRESRKANPSPEDKPN